MKSTFLLSIFALVVSLSHAQNSPCTITKLDWQTALTSDEGTVSYFMESSDCKGKELCGQPKIGLKHSFKKPIWIKVKLKGFNCDNQAIVGEFYTNRTYITANEVYVAKHNWHNFKAISEVVNVEVAYEQTTVQSMIYNKDGNTLDTYVDGKFQRKAPTADELKAAAQDSAQKAQLLATAKTQKMAAVEQDKKGKTATSTPSVKNEKKTTAKAAGGQKIAEKQIQPKTNVAPSAEENVIVEKKATTKTPAQQKNAQKQVKKNTAKANNEAVTNGTVEKKQTTGTAKEEIVAGKPIETAATKNGATPIKTDSKTSVTYPPTTVTKEALIKATEPTVSEGSSSTPSVKTENATTDQAFVQPQPVAQPNGTKATNAVAAIEAAPSVKPKNVAAQPSTNKVGNQTGNKAGNPTANQAGVKRPVDKAVEKPQGNMPAKQPQKAVDAKKAAATPVIIEPEYTPINVLKSNLLYPISLGFEHGLGKHFSLFANGFFMPVIGFNNLTKGISSVKLLKPSVGFAAEARYYISKEKAPLNGIYWGGFFTTRAADIALNVVSTTSTGSTDATINIPLGLQMYGLMIGKQRIREKGFTTDFGIGLGSYSFFGIPNISPNAEGVFGRIGELTKNKTGIAPRLNVSLGYAF